MVLIFGNSFLVLRKDPHFGGLYEYPKKEDE
jgi:hypothetical protein